MYYSYFDAAFLVFVIPAMLFSMVMSYRVKATYKKYTRVVAPSGLTGAQAAWRVLSHYGITNVRIELTGGRLSDHYDPRANVIRLSEAVYHGNNVAAIGVACHEAGHAAQHAQNYAPIKLRNSFLPICKFGSGLGLPLVLIGYYMAFEPLITIGLGLYSLICLFQLITLPVEFNASRRALQVIDETGMLSQDEVAGSRKVLSAAAMTYVAALAVSIANLLRIFLRFNNRKR